MKKTVGNVKTVGMGEKKEMEQVLSEELRAVYVRPFLGIDFVHYGQYLLCQLIPLLDFINWKRKGVDPAKYIFQYSLWLMWAAFFTDLLNSDRLSTLCWLAIVSQVFYTLVIGVYYAGFSDFTDIPKYESVNYYRKKSVNFDFK